MSTFLDRYKLDVGVSKNVFLGALKTQKNVRERHREFEKNVLCCSRHAYCAREQRICGRSRAQYAGKEDT